MKMEAPQVVNTNETKRLKEDCSQHQVEEQEQEQQIECKDDNDNDKEPPVVGQDLKEFVRKTSLDMDYVEIVGFLENLEIPLYIDHVPLWLYAALHERNVKVYVAALTLFCLGMDENMGGGDSTNRYKAALYVQKGFDIDLNDLVTKELEEDEEFMEDYKGVSGVHV